MASEKFSGKSFGALKSAIIRMLRSGYAPQWTTLTVSVADRERLRKYCATTNQRSMVEGFHALLDQAGVEQVKYKSRTGGSMEGLISALKQESNEYDGCKLAEMVRDGEYDDFIKSNHS